jgi:glyoxylase-like metal-dependent hydrolase (beta-lactamase superfamily II)
MSDIPIINPDSLAALHGKRPSDIYVILSPDRSTVVFDPGMGRPWSSSNRKVAEHFARTHPVKGCIVATLHEAINAIIRSPKNAAQ